MFIEIEIWSSKEELSKMFVCTGQEFGEPRLC